jgi:hypothetical protein
MIMIYIKYVIIEILHGIVAFRPTPPHFSGRAIFALVMLQNMHFVWELRNSIHSLLIDKSKSIIMGKTKFYCN